MDRAGAPFPPRILDGGAGTPDGQKLAEALSIVAASKEDPGSAERVWRALSARRGPAGRRPVWAYALAAACAAAALWVAVLLRRSQPDPTLDTAFGVLSLTSGEVFASGGTDDLGAAHAGLRLKAGARLRTAASSRAYVRFDSGAGVLVGEHSVVTVRRAAEGEGVDLAQGWVAAWVAPRPGGLPFSVRARDWRVRVTGTLFSVRAGDAVEVEVGEGAVSVQGPDSAIALRAGECWSTAAAARPCAGPPEGALLKVLGIPSGPESLLRLDGDPNLAVEVDGLVLGRPPVEWWSPVGRHRVAIVREERRLPGEVAVLPGQETRFVFGGAEAASPPGAAELALKPGGGPVRREAAAVAPAAAAPPDRPASSPSVSAAPGAPAEGAEPLDPVARLSRRVEAAASEPEREEALYALGRALVSARRYAEAVAAFAPVAGGRGVHAEIALYEVGRITNNFLGDPRGARPSLEAYRRRYPEGGLRQEVDLTLIESLLAEGAPDGALGEMDAFLAAYPQSERRAEIGLLKGNLLRERGECAAAVGAYDQALRAAPHPKAADDASYFAAVCAAQLGQGSKARQRLEEYRAHFPMGRHRDEVERALGGLGGR